ncbi:sulfotransferase 1 family member D1-like isoform X1 [Vanessa cardui]|uniref:sulfotransferase 1 family member D1-like isoform X1 n=2 Tax=Vanessa cardui TaxID=171605 RepID=UPI001F132F13|nr:sulfotransferase 1 family member D1-like isoform X1 [Vanessa cardui]XP_046959910.1 sulfotransferase 1 family member D1-like isoform X1 [Vanessa cardui]
MAEKVIFPYEIKNVTEEEDKLVKKYYKDYVRPFIRVGPHGYFWMAGFGDHAADIYNLEVRPDDIWVVSFSRSGTTWLQELVWLIANNLNYDGAATTPLTKRYAFIEYPTQASEKRKDQTPSTNSNHRATFDDFRNLHTLTSPRFVKTHLPLSLLPPKLLDTAKVLYIARDPRDVAVSFHFMHKLFRYFDEGVTFEEFWDLFKKDLLLHLPIFPHIEEAWAKRDHENMMFLFYEEMQKNLQSVIDKVCKFLGKDYTNEQKVKLAEHLSFENMKKSSGFKFGKSENKDSEITFMRKGKSGNWINYFNTEKMKKEVDEYFEKHMKSTDLRFPEVN